MSVGLHRLLEGPHFLYLNKLTAPLLINGISLISFQPKFFRHAPLSLFEIFNFFLKLLDLFVSLFSLLTLESIDSFQEAIWIFDFMLDQRPQLLEKSTQILRLFLSLLEFLIK